MQTRKGEAGRQSFSRENRRRRLHLAGLPHNARRAPLFPGGSYCAPLPRSAKPLSSWSISWPAQSLPERNGGVTFFARPAEGAVMVIVLAVACITSGWGADLCRGGGLVAGMARKRTMRAGQGVGGLPI